MASENVTPPRARVRCVVCDLPPAEGGMCAACRRSYDRAIARDDGTIMATIRWAATRARRAERRRLAAPGARA
jgi:hypothetical protein